MGASRKVKNILITGGAGFIGSHLCELFLDKGYKVVCLDNLITGKLSNIRHLLKNKNFKFIKHNVSEYIDIPTLIEPDFPELVRLKEKVTFYITFK